MSNIGRRPIEIGNVEITIQGNQIHFKGKKASGVHELPAMLSAALEKTQLKLLVADETDDANCLWGLHRALLANKIRGADVGFDKQIRIVGLGFKAVAQGSKLQFSLGFSHKIDFELPAGITIEIDKTGQLLTLRSADKELLGLICSKIRSLRPPEPYKGTGVKYEKEVLLRKAGKAKSA